MSGVLLVRRRGSRTLWVGGLIVAAVVALAVIGSWITPYDPVAFAMHLRFAPPSLAHPFGTDEFGRDVFSRVLAGARFSLAMGFGAMAISVAVGVPLGLLAAFHRGIVEEAIMRAV